MFAKVIWKNKQKLISQGSRKHRLRKWQITPANNVFEFGTSGIRIYSAARTLQTWITESQAFEKFGESHDTSLAWTSGFKGADGNADRIGAEVIYFIFREKKV